MLRLDTRQPDHLLILLAIDQNIRGEFVTTDMRHEKNTHSARSRVIRVPVQTQGTKMSLKLALDQWSRDTAARVSSSV